MEENYLLLSFVLVPLIGFLASLLIPEKNEAMLSRIAIYTSGFQLFASFAFFLYWIFNHLPNINVKELVLFQSKEYCFFIDFHYDYITSAYLIIGSFVTFLITRYSRYYMHMENGYKRFFNTILFFFFGYNFTVVSGNFETLFIGWEILGISSFLLIAFYRERYLPVRNAVKVFSIYRIGDVGIILAMWASHHLWHENITFYKLNNFELVHHQLEGHSGVGIFIGICILIAASAKSAQLPFSSWLPRAMEGPTPSSAIFYGSLSVHFGVFLLLRTFPFWEQQIIVRILIGLVGVSTALVCFYITRVQSSIKAQIAYASITQIGIIFIEIALGWHVLALIHFTGNAFLRTYQLLVSPSVVAYLIRDQFYSGVIQKSEPAIGFNQKWKNTIYILSVKEWHLHEFMYNGIFKPLKKIGQKFNFITLKNILFYFIPIYGIGLFIYFKSPQLPKILFNFLPEIFALIALIFVLKAFSERKSPMLAWLLIILNHFCIALSVSFNEHYDYHENIIYLSGIVVSGLVGFIILNYLSVREENNFNLSRYFGHIFEYRRIGFIFLIASLGLMGFPITPSFIGEDLIFSHVDEHQYILSFLNSLSFIIGGIALIRMFSRLFLGPHIKTDHATPLKSS